MQVKKQQLELDMEQQTGSKLGKEYIKDVYIITLLIYLIRRIHHVKCWAGWSTSWDQDCWEGKKKIAGRNINNLRHADDTTLMEESEEPLKEDERGEWKKLP